MLDLISHYTSNWDILFYQRNPLTRGVHKIVIHTFAQKGYFRSKTECFPKTIASSTFKLI